jgi:hypothetical protein
MTCGVLTMNCTRYISVVKDAHKFIGAHDLKVDSSLIDKYPVLSTEIFYDGKYSKDVYMIALRSGEELTGYNEKHEFRNRETMKMYDLW